MVQITDRSIIELRMICDILKFNMKRLSEIRRKIKCIEENFPLSNNSA